MSEFEIEGLGKVKSYDGDPGDAPIWYQHFLRFKDPKKNEEIKKAMQLLKKHKPETYKFIQASKCELVGIMPLVSYNLPTAKGDEGDVTWFHGFAVPTLLFWHPEGEMGLFVNPILKYNDSIINHQKGNEKESISGFTG